MQGPDSAFDLGEDVAKTIVALMMSTGWYIVSDAVCSCLPA